MKNIVLIGMPGSGKTSVGTIVAERLRRKLLDTDAMVAAAEGQSISTIFNQWGERYFREAESAMTKQAAAEQSAVIATGGGVVLCPKNMTVLAQTGVICFLDRPPEDIAKEDHTGRPLIGTGRDRVFELYTQRIKLYQKYAEYTIQTGRDAAETAETLMRVLEGKL